MTALLKDHAFHEAVERAVRAAEVGTAGEIVVALAPASGRWQDLPLRTAAFASLATLATIVYEPTTDVPHWLVLPIAAVVWVAVHEVVKRVPALVRHLASEGRLCNQVREGAEVAFQEERVAATPGRTGVLLYVSLTERRAEILGDMAVRARIPDERWLPIARPLGRLEGSALSQAILEAIEAIGRELARGLPAAGPKANDLSDKPRIRA